MDHTLSEVLADFCSSATEASIPSGVRASARQRLLDTVGACLAAVSVDTCRAVVEYVCAEGWLRSTNPGLPILHASRGGFHKLDRDQQV